MISYRYYFDGMEFYAPPHFISLFYNYLYLNALCEEENRTVASSLLDQHHTAFTDLATLSLNCQARSAAIFVSLVRNGLINEVQQYDTYLKLFRTNKDGTPIGDTSYENVQLINGKGEVHLLSPVVPHTFSKNDTERYYEKYCSRLSNKKDENNYLDVNQMSVI